MAMSKVAKPGEGEMAEDYYYYQHQHSRHRDISSPEVSSSYAAARKDAAEVEEGGEREEELELGLSLGATKAGKGAGVATASTGPWREYCRILTAKDFPSMVSSRVVSPNSSSSASSSFPMGGSGGDAAGTKRGSDSVAHEVGSNTPSHVVGWPPIRAYRINNLFNQSKDNASENNHNVHEKKSISQTANTHHKSIKNSSIQENAGFKDHEKKGRSLFVKVNMDGMAIGRKVDLSSHQSYDTLALALEDMFEKPSSLRTSFKSTKASTSKLLDGSSEFVLTYEDKDGDWMLVGDVPWGMFLSTVRRLRIMRTTDANGLAPRIQSSIMDVFRSKPV